MRNEFKLQRVLLFVSILVGLVVSVLYLMERVNTKHELETLRNNYENVVRNNNEVAKALGSCAADLIDAYNVCHEHNMNAMMQEYICRCISGEHFPMAAYNELKCIDLQFRIDEGFEELIALGDAEDERRRKEEGW